MEVQVLSTAFVGMVELVYTLYLKYSFSAGSNPATDMRWLLKKCRECGKDISEKDENALFCDKSCAARYNNKAHPKRKKEGKCVVCSTPIRSVLRYCSKECRAAASKTRRAHKHNGVVAQFSGPYKWPDGRLYMSIRRGQKRTTQSYPRWLLEQAGVDVSRKHVHHIDGDFTNNDPTNLFLVEPSSHAELHAKKLCRIDLLCPECGRWFSLEGRRVADAFYNRRRGCAGPFCSKRCAGVFSRGLHLGRRVWAQTQVVKSYVSKFDSAGQL